MRAVDTSVLVHAQIVSSTHHATARALLTELAESSVPWAIPWPCIYEYLRIVTHARVFDPPVPQSVVIDELRRILASPSLVLLSETERHAAVMGKVVEDSGVSGNLLQDAHIAALCLEHGIRELITGDGDFARFRELKTTDPFR